MHLVSVSKTSAGVIVASGDSNKLQTANTSLMQPAQVPSSLLVLKSSGENQSTVEGANNLRLEISSVAEQTRGSSDAASEMMTRPEVETASMNVADDTISSAL